MRGGVLGQRVEVALAGVRPQDRDVGECRLPSALVAGCPIRTATA